MWIPFHDQWDHDLRTGRPWVRTALCALFADHVVAMHVLVLRSNGDLRQLTAETFAVVMAVAAAVGMTVGLLLETRDAVDRRMAAGRRVPWLLRLFFGGGRSLWLWSATILLVAVFGAVATA